MAITVANLITNLDTVIGDTSTDRISQAERLQFLTESVAWLQQTLGNDHQNCTYDLNYYDSLHIYKITSAVADLLEVADLRQGEYDQFETLTRKSPRELAEEIAQGYRESSYAIERRDGNCYLVVNHESKYDSKKLSSCDSIDAGGGTWAVDSTNSDATNLTIDTNEYTEGTGSFNFDVDVSQSGNNRATIVNSTLTSSDLSNLEGLGSWLVDVYIPDVTNISSVTLYWGSSSSNYYSSTSTTDYNGQSFVNGWNTLKFDWQSATTTGAPVSSAITYSRIDINYTGSQTDDTDFRIDNIRVVRPERLTFHYISFKVGTSAGGSDIFAFTATTDIPYFSGQYDHYKFAVAEYAGGLAFKSLRLWKEANEHMAEATRTLGRVSKIIPSSKVPELKSFKVKGISFRRSRGGRRG